MKAAHPALSPSTKQDKSPWQNATNGKKPDLIAYNVRKTDAGEFWTRIGVAWKHTNTEGFNADLAVFPLSGKIVFLPPKEKPAGTEEPAAE